MSRFSASLVSDKDCLALPLHFSCRNHPRPDDLTLFLLTTIEKMFQPCDKIYLKITTKFIDANSFEDVLCVIISVALTCRVQYDTGSMFLALIFRSPSLDCSDPFMGVSVDSKTVLHGS
jgi:hypothetical protein